MEQQLESLSLRFPLDTSQKYTDHMNSPYKPFHHAPLFLIRNDCNQSMALRNNHPSGLAEKYQTEGLLN
ncbi:MAG TPA: hypothetical protein DCM28_05475 [Phycisphaerales bacterium]|nr:hypothetical protein [Phycisphaerales bacterium]